MKKFLFLCAIAAAAYWYYTSEMSRRGTDVETPDPNSRYTFSLGKGPAGIHFGMTADEVRARLGEPEKKDAQVLGYPDRGFAVRLHNDRVFFFFIGGLQPQEEHLRRAFKGETVEGISLGSREEDVLHAYGAPTERTVDGSTTFLRYTQLKGADKVAFGFRDRQLKLILCQKRP